jgi:hypothetical protein
MNGPSFWDQLAEEEQQQTGGSAHADSQVAQAQEAAPSEPPSPEPEPHPNGPPAAAEEPESSGPESAPDIIDGGVPFQIVRAMREALHQAGFDDENIAKMTPAEAWQRLPADVRERLLQAPQPSPESEQPRTNGQPSASNNGHGPSPKEQIIEYVRANPQRAYELLLPAPLQEKRTGKKGELYTNCPFHTDNDPSWRVDLTKGDNGTGYWFCDPCGFGGTFFRLAELINNSESDFPATLKFLAELLSINGYHRNGYLKADSPNNDAAPHTNGNGPQPRETESDEPKHECGPQIRKFNYEIRDIDGKVRAIHTRVEYACKDETTGKNHKTFFWPKGTKTAELPLYGVEQLPELPERTMVIVNEGEKATEAVWKKNYHAVGTVCGAGTTPIDEQLRPLLRHNIYLSADNQDDGREHMQNIRKRLMEMGHDYLWSIQWPEGFPHKGDMADFIGDIDELIRNAHRIERPWLILRENAHEALAGNEEYLSRQAFVDRLYYSHHGSVTVGGKHDGKTTNVRTEALSLAIGKSLYGRQVVQTPVIYAVSDDEHPSTRMQLLKMGWNPKVPLELVRIDPKGHNVDGVLEDIARLALRNRAYFVVLDMLFDFARIADENKYAHTREAIGKIQQLADAISGHVKATHHSPKWFSNAEGAAKAVLGSQGIVARFSPVVLCRKWADGLYTIESTMTRDPRGLAIPPSCVTLDKDGWANATEEFKGWMKWKVYKQRIIDLLESGEPGKRWAVNAVAEVLQISRQEIQNAMYRMTLEETLPDGTISKPVLERMKKLGGQGGGYTYALIGVNTLAS